jgi:hypothetical protein
MDLLKYQKLFSFLVHILPLCPTNYCVDLANGGHRHDIAGEGSGTADSNRDVRPNEVQFFVWILSRGLDDIDVRPSLVPAWVMVWQSAIVAVLLAHLFFLRVCHAKRRRQHRRRWK